VGLHEKQKTKEIEVRGKVPAFPLSPVSLAFQKEIRFCCGERTARVKKQGARNCGELAVRLVPAFDE
jgi:hypothetical protein